MKNQKRPAKLQRVQMLSNIDFFINYIKSVYLCLKQLLSHRKALLFHIIIIVFRKHVGSLYNSWSSCKDCSARLWSSTDVWTLCVCAGVQGLSVCDRGQGLCRGPSGIMGRARAGQPALEPQWRRKHLLSPEPQPGAGPQGYEDALSPSETHVYVYAGLDISWKYDFAISGACTNLISLL